MTFEYGNTKVFYTVEGEGRPVLLLHGWGCTHSIFDSVVPAFEGKYRVYTFDLPGFGESDEPDSVWGVEDYTGMVEAFCKHEGLESPALLGHSFGGRISILFSSRNKVSRVVLVDAAGIKPRRTLRYHIKVCWYKTWKFVVLKVLRSEKLFRRLGSRAGSSDYRNASDRMKAILSRTVNEDLRSRLPLIKAPTLLFWGTRDTATPIGDARLMEKSIPDAGLVEVPGAGHFSFLEAPGTFAAVIKSFFEIC